MGCIFYTILQTGGGIIGVFEKVFGKQKERQHVNTYFKMLTGYTPAFTTYDGGLYEMELTRSAINAFATHASKLSAEINGSAYKELTNVLKYKPNPYMTTSQFIYRVATILSVCNTCYIVPIEDRFGYITGYYPLIPTQTEVLEHNGESYLRYSFSGGQRATIEYRKVGILTNFQYKNDFGGETNNALQPTMELISTQNQGIIEGVKNSAFIRFIAKMNNFANEDDIKQAREDFVRDNLNPSNNGGIILLNNQFQDVQQINSQPFVINAVQQKQIQDNVFSYFGVNEKILQNSFTEDGWNAFYEGKIEPFAIQLSLALSTMTFTQNELARGNEIIFTANRLQYASNTTKLQVSTQLFDRGIITTNQVCDIWNMAHVEDGDKRYIRKEYAGYSNTDKEVDNETDTIQVSKLSDGTE